MKKLETALLLAGIPETHADLRYACGFTAPDPVVFLAAPRRRILLVNEMEAGRARRTVRRAAVCTPSELSLNREQRRSLAGWIAGLLKRERIRRVRVDGQFPLGLARTLEAAGIRVDLAEGPVFPEREIKRPDERAALRAAQRAAVAAMRQAVALLRAAQPGRDGILRLEGRPLSADRLRAEVAKALLERGCEGSELIVAGGPQSADPHQTGRGLLRAHQPIVLDFFPRHQASGYWGDLTRTVVRGAAPPRLAAMYRAVKAAQAAVLAAVRPGASGADLHARAAQILKEHGFEDRTRHGAAEGFIHSTGHGVGLAIHERPRLSPTGSILKPGHVVTVEPGLYYRAIGGVRIEDTVEVTPTGCAPLAVCPAYFEL